MALPGRRLSFDGTAGFGLGSGLGNGSHTDSSEMFRLVGERSFGASRDAPHDARCFVGSLLGNSLASVLDTALLVTSELVTNVVQHGQGDADVRVLRDDRTLRIEVADTAQAEPEFQPPSTGSERGRGILLIRQVASDWGVERRPGAEGKVVWCLIPIGQ